MWKGTTVFRHSVCFLVSFSEVPTSRFRIVFNFCGFSNMLTSMCFFLHWQLGQTHQGTFCFAFAPSVRMPTASRRSESTPEPERDDSATNSGREPVRARAFRQQTLDWCKRTSKCGPMCVVRHPGPHRKFATSEECLPCRIFYVGLLLALLGSSCARVSKTHRSSNATTITCVSRRHSATQALQTDSLGVRWLS